ncbi:MAG: molecular chaperone HtpG [Candidatus Absconditabacterales bacterium]|nr:molecular chaperone HtpG [Candidatus Absconditabacterales bacterium]
MAKKTSHDDKHVSHSNQFDFSADVGQLIQLVTHSIYSTKEIFLRELIANANDAIQKAKILSLHTDEVGELGEPEIRISVDEEAKTITIMDNGIGMNADDMQKNLGTIANSGTKAFLSKLAEINKDKKDEKNPAGHDLIGQFGIGFYSVFMVASKVEVDSKKHGSDAKLWTSDGKGVYTISDGTRKDRGTTITIYLNEASAEFANHWKISSIIKKHSNYIPTPIFMNAKDKDGKVQKDQREQVNAMQAIWTKRKADVKEEEYKEFGKSLFWSDDEPLDIIHVHTEGGLSYKCLLYIPKKKPAFMFDNDPDSRGPDLYVQNVLIMQKCKHLLPNWLRFVKGVVETNDVDLNVSREILQDSPVIQKLQQSLVKEVMKSLAWKKKKAFADYKTFFDNFGRHLKEGMANDWSNREKISEVALFYNADKQEFTDLDAFVPAESEGESASKNETNNEKKDTDNIKKPILYLVGTSISELHQSPYARKNTGQPMIFVTDPIDEYVLQQLREHKGHPFKLASDATLFEDESLDLTKEQKNIIAYLQGKLTSYNVEKIQYSSKLGTVPAMFVSKESSQSAQMQKVLKAMGHAVQEGKKTLMLNPNHHVVKKFEAMHQEQPHDPKTEMMAKLLADQATMLEGGDVNVTEFLDRVNQLVV